MVIFFQPTFHKYFLEQAQGWNPNLAYSFPDVIEFTCLGVRLPHLPTGSTGMLLSSHAAPAKSVDHVCMSLLQGLEGFSPSSATIFLGKFLQTLCSPWCPLATPLFTALHPQPQVSLP